jgi:hypothetical protein
VSIYNASSAGPFLVAVSASSPYVEGKATGKIDNRLIYYRENQRKLPIIGHGIIPERLRSKQDYLDIQERMYAALRKEGADILCHEWVDSRGLIVRFSRNCGGHARRQSAFVQWPYRIRPGADAATSVERTRARKACWSMIENARLT